MSSSLPNFNEFIKQFKRLSTPSKAHILIDMLSSRSNNQINNTARDTNLPSPLPDHISLSNDHQISPSNDQQAPSQSSNQPQNVSIPPTDPPEENKSNGRKKYDDKKRLTIVLEAIKTGNNCKIARDYAIDESTIRDWVKKFKEHPDVLKEMKKSRSKKRNRTGKFSEMEKQLLAWILEQREKKLSVNMLNIINKAKELVKQTNPGQKFSGSHMVGLTDSSKGKTLKTYTDSYND